MNQFDVVKLINKQGNVKSGSIGTIVYCHKNAFEVEFMVYCHNEFFEADFINEVILYFSILL